MCPPFFAKNSTANSFSRVASIILRRHFDAVWPGEGSSSFQEWWAHASEFGLCYSFECVCPRIAGDHGATPKTAYMVLTAVSASDGARRRFLSPLELLYIAKMWRLPLNEVWYFEGDVATAVEGSLHEHRWRMTDSSADAILNGYADSCRQGFLTHAETQGEVLEGFVLMLLEVDIGALSQLARAYTDEMKPYHQAALDQAAEFGVLCHNRDAALVKVLEAPIVDPEPIAEPERLATDQPTVWAMCRAGGPDTPIARMFEMLWRLYAGKVKLRHYKFRGKTFVHIDCGDDQIFYGWAVHMATGCAPLYRGMVIELDSSRSEKQFEVPALPSMRIIEVGKLKCLNYLVRTFGVRNILGVLTEQGKEAYMARIQRGFLRNWSVPAEYHAELEATFSGWADLVERMGGDDRDSLTDAKGSYLEKLEPYLSGELAPAEVAGPQSSFMLLVANLTGRDLNEDQLGVTAGFRHVSKKAGTDNPTSGVVLVLPAIPPTSLLVSRVPKLLVVFGTDDAADVKWSKMTAHARSPDFGAKLPAGVRLYHDPTAEQWASIVAELPTDLPGGEAPAEVKPRRTIVAIAGLPPGGGKSTFFAQLALAGATVISSDEHKGGFDDKVRQALRKSDVVGYDKNIPNADGLAKLVRILTPSTKDYDLRAIVVVPQTIDADECWRRIAARPAAHIGLHTHDEGGEAKAFQLFESIFLQPCRQSLADFHEETGAMVTPCFFSPIGEISQLVQSVRARFQADDLPALVTLGSAAGGGGGDAAHGRSRAQNWVGATLESSNLHMTLVPPTDQASAEHRAYVELWAGREGAQLTISCTKYHHAWKTTQRKNWSIGFWEVDSVEGLRAEADHYAPQSSAYHVTDVAAISGQAKPKSAKDILELIKQAGPDYPMDTERQVGEWSVFTFVHAFTSKATVEIH